MRSYTIPGNTTNISDNWEAHRARGSLGGTDFTDGRGTTMCAMQSGIVTIVDNSPDGSGGRYIRVLHDDGTSTEELHADRITAVRGQRVSLREGVGISGGSGYGDDFYYGAHIHAHGIDAAGVRFNVEPYINWADPTRPAGNGGTTPIGEETDMLFLGNNTILWPNGFVNAYDANTYKAIQLAAGGDPEPSRVATLVREAWKAIDFLDKREAQVTATTVVATLQAAGVPITGTIDTAKIAKDVIAALPSAKVSLSESALKAIAALDDAEFKAILAKLDTVDEATLAAFGLMRA